MTALRVSALPACLAAWLSALRAPAVEASQNAANVVSVLPLLLRKVRLFLVRLAEDAQVLPLQRPFAVQAEYPPISISPAVPHGRGRGCCRHLELATVALPHFLLRFALQADGAALPVATVPRGLGVARLGEGVRALLARGLLLRIRIDGVILVRGIVS